MRQEVARRPLGREEGQDMVNRQMQLRLAVVEEWGRSGRAEDIDRLMEWLEPEMTFTTSRLVDYALGLVTTPEGEAHIQHYLFEGTAVQRNYAALYFKRRGEMKVLDLAVRRGCIDELQAFSK